MGLGPSIKMTTLHHFRCPVTRILSSDPDIEFTGILVDGVSEVFDDKYYTAERTADLAEILRADGAVVAIDGWGNHHVDFVNVIGQLGLRGIPAVGLSYIGQQGRLVCTDPYVDCIVDFNKSDSGYESCVVGQNNLNSYDAFKAVSLLKSRLYKTGKLPSLHPPVFPDTGRAESSCHISPDSQLLHRLIFKEHHVRNVLTGPHTSLDKNSLVIREGIEASVLSQEPLLRDIHIQILPPGHHSLFVNSNLDFSPIACKISGHLGSGCTHLLSGITVMLTGVEEASGFQPSNIGSSEGFLSDQVVFDRAGTPASDDHILHIDVTFREGEGRTARGIQAAHRAADRIVNEIRDAMKDFSQLPYTRKEFYDVLRPGKPKIILVKIVSGLGCMYDTALFPTQPAGFLGSHNMMDSRNLPYALFPNQCRDGAIHSLI